jgi:tRNA-binding EMAP/Myf-like protein
MYQAHIVEIKELKPHPNADRLQVATIFGLNVIVGLDVKLGDIMVYFSEDGRLNTEYCRVNNLLRIKDEQGNSIGGYLEESKCKVGTIKLRGERSEGLLMPLSSLATFTDISQLKVGDTFTTLNGTLICEKYIVKKSVQPSQDKNVKGKKLKVKDNYPLFQHHIDTIQYAYNKHEFKIGDDIIITLKCHGTSGICSHTIKETKSIIPSFIYPLLKLLHINPKSKREWDYVSSSRRVILRKGFDGYYKDKFREKWHNFFIGKLHKGESVFYEIVGFTENNGSIMPICDNKKTKDKEFIKRYGEKTNFTYGCNEGENDIYLYRMTMTNEDGFCIEYPWDLVKLRAEQMGVKTVPEIDRFTFSTIENLDEKVALYSDGEDLIDPRHIREGVVVRVNNSTKFKVFKNKGFSFKILENIIKLDDVEDLEDNS